MIESSAELSGCTANTLRDGEESLSSSATWSVSRYSSSSVKRQPRMRSVGMQALARTSAKGTQTRKQIRIQCDTDSDDVPCYTCYLCRATFPSKDLFKRHYRSRHETRSKIHRCRFCDYSSACTASVRNHERVHTGERPHVCPVCGRGFTQRVNLTTHMRTIHQGERNYACGTCGRSFQRKQHLREHEAAVHSGEERFPCRHCGKGFPDKGELREHLRTHGAERPFACSTCGNTFTCRGSLARHVVCVHTKQFPHRCEECGRGFYLQAELAKHARKKHVGCKD